MRVTTAFNRILALPGASVASVTFTDAGLVLGLRRRARRRLQCPCGTKTWARYDTSRRRWRHLDFGVCRVFVEADIHRIDCATCRRVRTEQVPWARPGARFTRDVEDLVAWLAQRMDKTSVARLVRCSWAAVHAIVARVVAEHLHDARLDELYRIGVDEIAYTRGHRYLTIVADHDTGRVVWVGRNREQATFEAFFTALGRRRTAQLQAISMDAAASYLPVARDRAPQATICLDPFHVIKWTNEALDLVYRADGGHPTPQRGPANRRDWRQTRYALRAGAERLDQAHHDILNALRRYRYRLWRAWELKEQLRDLYRTVDAADARAYLKAWCTSALRSRIPAYRNLVTRLRRHFDAIIAAVELGLSNGLAEGTNGKIRLIQRRGYGIPNLDNLIAMIYLCLGGITITPPQHIDTHTPTKT